MSTITGLSVSVIESALHTPFVTAQRTATSDECVSLRLTDADGVVGWGEGPQSWRVTGESLAGVSACLEGPLREVLLGAALDDLDTLLDDIQGAVVGNPSAKMAADLAVHDLAARRRGVTVTELLGGPSGDARLVTDVTLSAGAADDLAAAARDRVADGFGTLKMKVGTGGAQDVDRVRAVREAVGPDVVIRLDANQGWDVPTAHRVLADLADAGLGIELVEQPVARRDYRGLAEVARESAIPILADESVFDAFDLDLVAAQGAVSMVNVKIAKCGGLRPAVRLVERARGYGMQVLIGSMMESFVGIAAGAALARATGIDRTPDLDAAWWSVASPYADGPTYADGAIELPGDPGFGVTAVA